MGMPDTPAIAAPQHHQRTAVLLILTSCLFFAGMWGMIRMGSRDLHPFVLVVWRNIVGLILMLPVIWYNGGSWLRTARISVHLRRAMSSLVATMAAYYAVANTPMATAISISYAAPLIATVAAVIFLGEKIRARRITALIIGFIGVLIVVRPGYQVMTTGIAASCLAACATAISIIAVKRMTSTEDTRAIVFYSFLLLLLPSILLALPVWQWPVGMGWVYATGTGMFALGGQYCMTRAYKLADTSALVPYDFVRFILVIMIGVIWFGERVDMFTIIGGTIILVTTLYLAHRERVAAHSHKPTSAPKDIG